MGKFFDYAFKGIPYEEDSRDWIKQSSHKYDSPTDKNIYKTVADSINNNKLSIKVDEITGMQKNPYKAKALRSIFMTALSLAAFYAAAYASKAMGYSADVSYKYVGETLGLFVGIFGTKSVNDIINYIRARVNGYDEVKTEIYTNEEDMPEDLKEIVDKMVEEANHERTL